MSNSWEWGYMQDFLSFQDSAASKTFILVVTLTSGKLIHSSSIPNTPDMHDRIRSAVFGPITGMTEPLVIWNSVTRRLQIIPAQSIESIQVEFAPPS